MNSGHESQASQSRKSTSSVVDPSISLLSGRYLTQHDQLRYSIHVRRPKCGLDVSNRRGMRAEAKRR